MNSHTSGRVLALGCLIVGGWCGLVKFTSLIDNLYWLAFTNALQHGQISRTAWVISPTHLMQHKLTAMEAYWAGDCQEAGAKFDVALEAGAAPQVLWLFFAGNAYAQCQQPQVAIQRWQRAGAAPFWLKQCEADWSHTEIEAVVQHCDLARQIDPQLAPAYDYLGRAYFRLRRYPQAVEAYEAALRLGEAQGRIYLRTALAYEQVNDLASAENYLLKTLAREPEYAGAYFVLARVYFQQKRYGEAEARLTDAIHFDPTLPVFYVLLGDVYCLTQRPTDALTTYQRAASLDPTNAALVQKIELVNTKCH